MKKNKSSRSNGDNDYDDSDNNDNNSCQLTTSTVGTTAETKSPDTVPTRSGAERRSSAGLVSLAPPSTCGRKRKLPPTNLRRNEFVRLSEALERVTITQKPECWIIHGQTGTGKTMLLERLEQAASAHQQQQHPPFDDCNIEWISLQFSSPHLSKGEERLRVLRELWDQLIHLQNRLELLTTKRKATATTTTTTTTTTTSSSFSSSVTTSFHELTMGDGCESGCVTGASADASLQDINLRLMSSFHKLYRNVIHLFLLSTQRVVDCGGAAKTGFSSRPSSCLIVVVVDDLQYADLITRQVLERLLNSTDYPQQEHHQDHHPVLWIAAMSNTTKTKSVKTREHHKQQQHHNITSLLERWNDLTSIPTCAVHMAPLSVEDIRTMVPDDTDNDAIPLSMLQRKSGGNPAIAQQLIQEAQQQQQDIRRIKTASETAQLELFGRRQLDRMDEVTRTLVMTAAHLTKEFDANLLLAVVGGDNQNNISNTNTNTTSMTSDTVTPTLQRLVQEGLLVNNIEEDKSLFSFSYNRTREAIQKNLAGAGAKAYLLRIAKSLYRHLDEQCDIKDPSSLPSDCLYLMLSYFAENMESILTSNSTKSSKDTATPSDFLLRLSSLYLFACKQGVARGCFEWSERYLMYCRLLLEQSCAGSTIWRLRYDMALEVLNLLAAVQCTLRRYKACRTTVETIIQNARNIDDKMHALQMELSTYDDSPNNWHVGAQQGLVMLVHFDDTRLLMRTLTTQALMADVQRVRAILHTTSDEQILSLARPTLSPSRRKRDRRAGILHILAKTCSYAFLAGDTLIANTVALRAFQFGMENRLTGENMIIVVGMSAVVLVAQNATTEAARLAHLALTMAAKSSCSIATGLASAFVLHWKEPLHLSADHLLDATHGLVDTGNPGFASIIASSYAGVSFLLGNPLNNIAEELDSIHKRLGGSGSLLPLMRCYYHFAMNLVGATNARFELLGDANDRSDFHQLVTHDFSMQSYHLLKLQLAVYFGQWDKAEVLSDSLMDEGTSSLIPHFNAYLVNFFAGVSYWELHRQTSSRSYSKKAKQCMMALSSSNNDECCPTAMILLQILKAEEAASRNKETAPALFEQAISMADRARLNGILCLAHERHGTCLLSLWYSKKRKSVQDSNRFQARAYQETSVALNLYRKWQAEAKVRHLTDLRDSNRLEMQMRAVTSATSSSFSDGTPSVSTKETDDLDEAAFDQSIRIRRMDSDGDWQRRKIEII